MLHETVKGPQDNQSNLKQFHYIYSCYF